MSHPTESSGFQESHQYQPLLTLHLQGPILMSDCLRASLGHSYKITMEINEHFLISCERKKTRELGGISGAYSATEIAL